MSGWSQCMRVNSHRGADLVSSPSCSPAARLGGDVCLHERIRGCFTTWGPVRPPSAARGFDLLGLRDQFGMDSVEATGSPGNGNRTVFCFCSECLLVSLCWDGLCGGVLCPLVFVCSGWSLISNPAVLFRDKGKRKENSPSPARRLPLKQIRLRQIEAEEQRWRKWFQNKTTIFFSKNKIRDAFQQLQVMSADGCPETTKLCFLFQICFVFYKGDV